MTARHARARVTVRADGAAGTDVVTR